MIVDNNFPSIPRPGGFHFRRNRPLSRFEVWAWSPIIVLRIALVIIYVLYGYASIVAFIAGIPLFDNVVDVTNFTSIWALLMGPAAVVAAIASTTHRWETMEKWAALVLTALQSGYVIGMNTAGFILGDLDRQYVAAVALIAIVLPATRFVYLAAQSGKGKADDRDITST